MNADFEKQIRALGGLLTTFGLFLVVVFLGLFYVTNNPDVLKSKEDGLEPIADIEISLDSVTIAQSGFIDDTGVTPVIQNCTQCHSAKLVTQNRMSAEGWKATIEWMQETQNLWDLGDKQEKIVAYLAKNYGPQSKGRRQNLTNVEWYELEP